MDRSLVASPGSSVTVSAIHFAELLAVAMSGHWPFSLWPYRQLPVLECKACISWFSQPLESTARRCMGERVEKDTTKKDIFCVGRTKDKIETRPGCEL